VFFTPDQASSGYHSTRAPRSGQGWKLEKIDGAAEKRRAKVLLASTINVSRSYNHYKTASQLFDR
jgi:hypothetical protein